MTALREEVREEESFCESYSCVVSMLRQISCAVLPGCELYVGGGWKEGARGKQRAQLPRANRPRSLQFTYHHR